LPDDRVRAHFSAAIIRSVRATPLARVLAEVGRGGPRRLTRRRTWATLAGYQRLRRRLASCEVPPPGYRVGFLRLVDGRVRDRLGEIFASHFPPEPETSYADQLAHCEALTRWVVAPLGRGNATRAG
jgi:hypothetical protein